MGLIDAFSRVPVWHGPCKVDVTVTHPSMFRPNPLVRILLVYVYVGQARTRNGFGRNIDGSVMVCSNHTSTNGLNKR
jgi:hypothetical protein